MGSTIQTYVDSLLSSDTEHEVSQAGAALVSELVGAPAAICSLTASDELLVEASTNAELTDVGHTVPLSDRILARTANMDETVRIDDCTATRSAAASSTEVDGYRSVLLVPIAEWGMIIAADRSPGIFDEGDRRAAELVAGVLEFAVSDDGARSHRPAANEELETIANILSHDLVGPLGVARGYVEEVLDEDENEYLEKALVAIDRIDAITSSVETLARTGSAFTETEPVDIREVVERAWTTVESADASLQVETTATIEADEQGLCQLFENLFANAVEHGGPVVTVRVGTLADGFFVEDDGPGIPAADRERMFERGFTRADDRSHSGYGLSIVERIVEAHGWQIQLAESDAGGVRIEISGVSMLDTSTA